jgi:hypothetical protein
MFKNKISPYSLNMGFSDLLSTCYALGTVTVELVRQGRVRKILPTFHRPETDNIKAISFIDHPYLESENHERRAKC